MFFFDPLRPGHDPGLVFIRKGWPERWGRGPAPPRRRRGEPRLPPGGLSHNRGLSRDSPSGMHLAPALGRRARGSRPHSPHLGSETSCELPRSPSRGRDARASRPRCPALGRVSPREGRALLRSRCEAPGFRCVSWRLGKGCVRRSGGVGLGGGRSPRFPCAAWGLGSLVKALLGGCRGLGRRRCRFRGGSWSRGRPGFLPGSRIFRRPVEEAGGSRLPCREIGRRPVNFPVSPPDGSQAFRRSPHTASPSGFPGSGPCRRPGAGARSGRPACL